MKLIIKSPAPRESHGGRWGDYYFAEDLAKYLRRAGCDVSVQHNDRWTDQVSADATIVLRGKWACPTTAKEGLSVMWNISHPAAVPMEEYRAFDLVFVASDALSKRLSTKLGRPIYSLLQATDPDRFSPATERQTRSGWIFVGNTRHVNRPIVTDAHSLGVKLKLWGRGWDGLGVIASSVVDLNYPNERLADLYRSSRITLNDHWPDMKEAGIVNNRIFDALACGLPVLSDHHPALDRLKLPGVLLSRNKGELEANVHYAITHYATLSAEALKGAQVVKQEYSFATRAEVVIEKIRDLLAGKNVPVD